MTTVSKFFKEGKRKKFTSKNKTGAGYCEVEAPLERKKFIHHKKTCVKACLFSFLYPTNMSALFNLIHIIHPNKIRILFSKTKFFHYKFYKVCKSCKCFHPKLSIKTPNQNKK